MHRILFVLAALFFASDAFAQEYAIDKGSYLLGGAISFTSQGGDIAGDSDERLTTLTINPNFAYFVTPGLALGADVLYTSTSFSGNSNTSVGIGPQLSYFFGGPESSTYPFINAGVNYTSLDIGETVSGFGADFGGGIVFMVARNVGLTVQAFYQFSNLSADTDFGEFDLDSNTFGVQGGVTAFIF